jgi:hypothetical protein
MWISGPSTFKERLSFEGIGANPLESESGFERFCHGRDDVYTNGNVQADLLAE